MNNNEMLLAHNLPAVAGMNIKEYYGDGSDGAINTGVAQIYPTPTVTAPSGGIAANLIDGNVSNTLVTSAGNSTRVIATMDFGKLVAIGTFNVNQAKVDNGTASLQIQYSADNTSWSNYDTAINLSTSAANYSKTGPAIMARYWRISHTSGSVQVITIGETTWSFAGGSINVAVVPQTGTAVIQATSVTIAAGHTLSTDYPCQGLIIYSQGNVSISGTVSMSEKGSYVTEPFIPAIKALFGQFNKLPNMLTIKGGAGGNGGGGAVGGQGRLLLGGFGGGGLGGSGGQYGASGGGAIPFATCICNTIGTYGASSYSNASTTTGRDAYPAQPGCGGGGSVTNGSTLGITGRGGTGGRGYGSGAGGGGCGYNSDGNSGADGGYSGGFVCIVSKGNITINTGGSVVANGANGGTGGSASNDGSNSNASGGAGGGGAGGGVVILVYKGTYTNSGSITVNGGSGGAGGNGAGNLAGVYAASGASGSVGSIVTQKI